MVHGVGVPQAWLPSPHCVHAYSVWDLQTGVVRSNLRGHTWPVNFVAISPDNLTLVSGSANDTVR